VVLKTWLFSGSRSRSDLRDIRRFTVPSGRFDGVIGGPPCQDFSKARRDKPTGQGLEMLFHFKRIVLEARPSWWLAENVPGVPDMHIDGYSWQRLDLNASDLGMSQRRLRHVQFGAIDYSQLILIEKRHSAVTRQF